MKKFLVRLLLFLLPIIVLAYPFDVLLSKGLRKSNTYPRGEVMVWRDILDSKVNSDIVVYGSSRAWVHIDPQMLSAAFNVRAYNLGLNGHNFYLQNFRHKELLKYNSKPKVIIYSVDIFTLQKRPDLYNSDQFLPFMLWNPDFEKALNSYQGFDDYDYILPFKRYIGKYRAMISSLNFLRKKNEKAPSRINGYMGQARSWNSDLDAARATLSGYKVALDEKSIKDFDSFLYNCKNENIKVVLVYSPEYIDGQKFVSNRAYIVDLYKTFSQRHSIPFYDFSTDSISYKKEYFYNAEHLNKTGAELFTKELIEKLKNDSHKIQASDLF